MSTPDEEEDQFTPEEQALLDKGKKTRTMLVSLGDERANRGPDIPDATQQIWLGDGAWRYMRVCSDHRTLLLQRYVAKPPDPPPPWKPGDPFPPPSTPDPIEVTAGSTFTITYLETDAFTLTIKDAASDAILFVFPGSKTGFAKFHFTGTNWELREMGLAS